MRSESEILETALLHADTALRYAQQGLDEDVTVDACAMRLLAMIDALAGLDAGVRDELFGGDWHLMRGMRNRLVHGYATVNRAVLQTTLDEELPKLRETAARRLERQ